MELQENQRRLLALCALRYDDKSIDWSLIAREAMRGASGLDDLDAGTPTEKSAAATEARALLRRSRPVADADERVARELELADKVGARLVTVLDDEYPANLRLIANLPPFLFLLGTGPLALDLRSVCVVGTRDASDEGRAAAAEMASALVDAGVTVVSGLARGIDTVAHTTTLDHDGRTVAVIGTGITRTYPAENRGLAERIVAEGGLVVSQFWPSSTPARWTFPRRNVVMAGFAQGTVVIEASSTSGAKMQARLAHEHGKRVFLIERLVTDQSWASRYVEQRKAIAVRDASDVIAQLASPERIQQVTTERQLTLDLV